MNCSGCASKKSDGAKSDRSDLLLGIKRGKSREKQTKNTNFFESYSLDERIDYSDSDWLTVALFEER